MQASRVIELWVGLFVALGLLALFFVAMQVSNLGEFRSATGSYVVKAHFGNIGGLRVRAPVSMAGVTVGRVERIGFDDRRYEAVVWMRIDPAYPTLPEDTSASILTAGLLGEQYVGLSPGGSDVYLKDGDEIELTQSAIVLEQLISRFLFNKAEEGKGDRKDPAVTPAQQADRPSSSGVGGGGAAGSKAKGGEMESGAPRKAISGKAGNPASAAVAPRVGPASGGAPGRHGAHR